MARKQRLDLDVRVCLGLDTEATTGREAPADSTGECGALPAIVVVTESSDIHGAVKRAGKPP